MINIMYFNKTFEVFCASRKLIYLPFVYIRGFSGVVLLWNLTVRSVHGAEIQLQIMILKFYYVFNENSVYR